MRKGIIALALFIAGVCSAYADSDRAYRDQMFGKWQRVCNGPVTPKTCIIMQRLDDAVQVVVTFNVLKEPEIEFFVRRPAGFKFNQLEISNTSGAVPMACDGTVCSMPLRLGKRWIERASREDSLKIRYHTDRGSTSTLFSTDDLDRAIASVNDPGRKY